MGSILGWGSSGQQSGQQQRLNLNRPTQQYGDNQVKSTKYNFLTFIPMNILHQFSNLPNMYFLLICFLQIIPSISVTGGKPTILIPLSFVLVTVLIKDAYEEFMRYRKDRQENRRPILMLKNNGFQRDVWQNILCGHVIKILQNQLIPCDALILSTNLPDNKCFVETRSLDGQTNLKPKKAPESREKLHRMTPAVLATKNYEIQVGPPNEYFNNVQGSITIERQQVPISADNVLLRGCILRNCKQAICVAIYVGSNTKVIINSAKFSGKKSKLMAQIDKMVIGIFIKQIILSLVFAIFNTLLEGSRPNFIKLVGPSKFVFLTASWWLLMTYFVPISLIVTMQMIKLFQGSILQKDRRGYSRQYDCNISANNTSINENLGQIKFVFTDKTGTLTKNQMNFKKIIVNGVKYGERYDISQNQIASSFPKTTNVSFRDSAFLRNTNDYNISQALKIIFLCHDIIVNKEENGGFIYNSSSPDEIALINFGKLCGYELMQQQGKFTKIFDRKANRVIKFQKLAFLDFSSDRKRMSIIVRLPNNQIELLMKGADSIVEQRLASGQPSLQITKKYLQQFSIQGLRTLMIAKRKISEEEFNQWYKLYIKAKSSVQDREKKLQAVYQKIEVNMQLIGGTAVEDRLQDEVAQTIVMMKKAGIKFFILTGDKKQTAVSIGRSCGLISPYAKIFSFPQQQKQSQACKDEKVYLIDASNKIERYPSDIFHHQTICYRCTPVQKQNIVNYVKQKNSDLTLAIGDGANDVNMILAADVGVGVKGRQGTQATRVADIAIGQYKFLSFITLYYGREWYRKNATLVSYSFFKNWYHVSAVAAYGAYSYFSAMVIFDIYNYELFNALYTALPIVIYAVFDQQYDWEQSQKYNDIYRPGLSNSYFNSIVYFKNIGRGILYGVSSLAIVFMVLEDNIITSDGRMGYMWQSGSVLLFNIILVVNFRVIVLSSRFSIGMIIAILGSLILYWSVYWLQTKMFSDFKLRDSIHEQWTTIPIYFIHLILIFVLLVTQYAYRKYLRLQDKKFRLISMNLTAETLIKMDIIQGVMFKQGIK